MCDRPGRWLTPEEKAREVGAWDAVKGQDVPEDSGGRGFPDPDMVPWCDRLNALPGVCTVQSCAGHRRADGYMSSGHLWVRLDEGMAQAFDRRALDLAAHDYIEEVARVYKPWGAEVASITFAGNERNLLPTSMGTILRFFATLAEETLGA